MIPPRKVWLRLWYLIQQPSYRAKLLVFLSLGITLSIWALYSTAPYQPFLQEFSVTFAAVALIQFLWDFLGGDPLEEHIIEQNSGIAKQIEQSQQSIDNNLERIVKSSALLEDMTLFHLGIVRIWPSRNSFVEDSKAGLADFKLKVLESKNVFLLGITLWHNWLRDVDFRHKLTEALKNGAEVKILVYEPGSDIQKIRARDEIDPGDQMVGEIRGSVKAVMDIKSSLPPNLRINLQLRLTYEAHHTVQIIGSGERMLVGFYLSGLDGFSSPTMQIRGDDTRFYQIYHEQFIKLWERSKRPYECEVLRDLLEPEFE